LNTSAHILLQKFPILCSFTVLTISIRPGSTCHEALSFHDILQHMKHMSARKFHLQTITRKMTISSHLSMRDARMVVAIAEGWISFNLKTLSITDSSVDVVSMPQKEHQSFTTMPAAITSEPRLTVPAYNTHCNTLTLCVASYPPHRYITHQLKPFTHQCNILWHMHCNYINILPILTININFKILQLTFNSVNTGTCTRNTVKYTKINMPRSINTLPSGHTQTYDCYAYYYT